MTATNLKTTTTRPIYGLLTAGAISQVGSMLTIVSVPWFVLQTTGSAAKTGLTGVFSALPFIIAGIFGGALVDRVGFKRMSLIGDITSGLTIALIPLLYHTVGIAFWQLLALTFLGNLFDTPGNTGRQSLVPELAALAGMRLERANAFMQSIPRVATLFGPPIAGVLIAVIGASNVLWLDAATFAASALLIGVCVPPRAAADTADATPGRYFTELAEGLRFIWKEPLIRAMSILFAVGNLLDAPIGLLFSVYAIRIYHSAVPVGLIFAALGGGAVIGSLWFGAIGYRLPRRAILIFYCLPVAGMYATFAFTPPLIVLLIAVFIDGLAVGPVNPLTRTILQERIPVALRGRVQGMITAIAFMMIPLGRGLAGLLIDPVGLRAIFLSIAGGFLLISLGVALNPVFRHMHTSDASTPKARSRPVLPYPAE